MNKNNNRAEPIPTIDEVLEKHKGSYGKNIRHINLKGAMQEWADIQTKHLQQEVERLKVNRSLLSWLKESEKIQEQPTGCTKPNCDCIERAEAANGGNPVKSYQCLGDKSSNQQPESWPIPAGLEPSKDAPNPETLGPNPGFQLSKEEILQPYLKRVRLNERPIGVEDGYYVTHYDALKAMQEYADQLEQEVEQKVIWARDKETIAVVTASKLELANETIKRLQSKIDQLEEEGSNDF
jgi:hypothetical protein